MKQLTDFYATVRIGDMSYQFSDRIVTEDFDARLVCEGERVSLFFTS